MPRILALDYGSKKTGIAATDPLQIIASGLATVPTWQLLDWLDDYLGREEVSDLVVGESRHKDGAPNAVMQEVVGFERKFAKRHPDVRLHRQDEFYTSRRARSALVEAGVPKMKRREKEQVDRMAAALILQDFLEERRRQEEE